MTIEADIATICELLKPTMILKPIKIQGNGDFELFLKDNDNPRTKVRILNVPKNTIAIKSDDFKESLKYFNSTNGECKRSDYIIISENKRGKWVIFVELKQSPKCASYDEIVQQLTGTRCFYEYSRYTVKRFWKNKFTFMDNYIERYVVFPNINRTKKRPIVFSSVPPSIHDMPENAHRIVGSKAEFNELINVKL